MVMTLIALSGLAVAGWAIGSVNQDEAAAAFLAPVEQSAGTGPNAAGREVFVSSGCGGCHTLSAAAATGDVGPNLDQVKPSTDLVVARVTDGQGAMPAFGDKLSKEQIEAIADYIVKSTGG